MATTYEKRFLMSPRDMNGNYSAMHIVAPLNWGLSDCENFASAYAAQFNVLLTIFQAIESYQPATGAGTTMTSASSSTKISHNQ